MAKAGEELISPIGEKLVFLRTAAETDGELLEVEVTYLPAREEPPEHYHPFQTERFEVLTGSVRARIGGETVTFDAGDSFEVLPGVVHSMCNAGDDVMRMRWQVRPALKTEEFFEAVWSLAREGKVDARGKPRLLPFAIIARAYDREFRLARPAHAIQKIVFGILSWFGKRRGY
jgi:quercetin dioxygenase-like cupin family protein